MTDCEVFIINVDVIEGVSETIYTLSKPEGCGEGKYWVTEKDGQPAVFVNEHYGFPVFLQLVSNLEISAVGFSEKLPVDMHKDKGSCGGCFSLETSFSERSDLRRTPIIKDDPTDIAVSYHFSCCVGKKKIPIDPQIYNHGDTTYPDEPRRGGCLGVAGRLLFGRRGR